MKDIVEKLSGELHELKSRNHFRRLPAAGDENGAEKLIDVCSNDYLGIGITLPAADILKGFAAGSGGSRLLTGNKTIHEEFEKEFSSMCGAESGLLFPSGYQANLAILSTLPGRHDTVHYDERVHASIRDGLRLGFARTMKYPHQDYSSLEKNLKKGKGIQFVVTEALFSMEGDLCELEKLSGICRIYDANLILDEAHSTGLYGKDGSGWADECGADVFIRVMTFGKAIGRMGAMLVSPDVVKEYMINKARPFIYSTAPSPVLVALIREGVTLAAGRYGMAEIRPLRKRLSEALGSGIPGRFRDDDSPIVPIMIPGNVEVRKVAADLIRQGFDVRAILSPTVPAGSERLRIALHSYNTIDEMQSLGKNLRGL